MVQLYGRNLQVFTPVGERYLSVQSAFENDTPVFLGVSCSGHWYILAGKYREDGSMFPVPSQRYYDIGTSEGYLIHFPDVSQERVDRWTEKIWKQSERHRFSLACSTFAFSTLKDDFDIQIGDDKGFVFRGGPAFKRLIKSGFVNAQRNPVRFQFFRTHQDVPLPDAFQKRLFKLDYFYGILGPFAKVFLK